MSIGTTRTVALVGLRAVDVRVEAHVTRGLPGFGVIGASGTAAREASDRVRTALRTVDASLTALRVLVSLAPADLPKTGASFDLPMAVAVLAQRGIVGDGALVDTALLGELALDGAVRRVPGVLPGAWHLARRGVRRIVVAEDNAGEAATVPGLEIVPVATLEETVAVLRGDRPARRLPDPSIAVDGGDVSQIAHPHVAPRRQGGGGSDGGTSRRVATDGRDLADVRGQGLARRALEIAAAGRHHLLLMGPPGCGKSMLAGRLPGILPPLTDDEAFTLATVRSVAGTVDDRAVLDHRPPLRAPHHGISVPALLGGGSGVARPGQISLACGGVLFLDELFEWSRSVLDALREPLEERVVRVARSRATVQYPADVQVVAAANPCPCGGRRRCECPTEKVERYRSRMSGPLADRLDLAPRVEPLTAADLLGPPAESSAVVAGRVAWARAASVDRDGVPTARVPAGELRRTIAPAALRTLAAAVDSGQLTGRGHDRCMAVARTVADLDGADVVTEDHVDEALGHRLSLASACGMSA